MIHHSSLEKFRLDARHDAMRCLHLANTNPFAYASQRAVRELSERALHRPAPKVLAARPFVPDELRRVPKALPDTHFDKARADMQRQVASENANQQRHARKNFHPQEDCA